MADLERENRREFLSAGATAAAALLASSPGGAGTQEELPPKAVGPDVPTVDSNRFDGKPDGKYRDSLLPQFKRLNRYYPTDGVPEDGDIYLGRFVPGLRASGLPPVPVIQTDVPKLPFRVVDGVKEFHLAAEVVRREFYPDIYLEVMGYNGHYPGPYIEVDQGDGVRIVVENRLADPTIVHWHGIQVPAHLNGVPGVNSAPIAPGESRTYQFKLHQAGSFFYHSFNPLQYGQGAAGHFVVHPKVDWDPTVDRDFLLMFQNFNVQPATTVPNIYNLRSAESNTPLFWNWMAINGRSAPYLTPLVCKLGERVRVRLLNVSPMQGHAIHLHGHTFWITGHEGARRPKSSWVCRNNEVIGPAQVAEIEFIAYDAGDWVFHCHMIWHMMNHITPTMGPLVRTGVDVSRYKANLEDRPPVKMPHEDPGFLQPSYFRGMGAANLNPAQVRKLQAKREVRGMREDWYTGVDGLFQILRVLPEDLFDKVMNGDEPVAPASVFDEIVTRREREEKRYAELRKLGYPY
jgi:FtsP/CotA-like multicopper oxidase with cupredoxin domain